MEDILTEERKEEEKAISPADLALLEDVIFEEFKGGDLEITQDAYGSYDVTVAKVFKFNISKYSLIDLARIVQLKKWKLLERLAREGDERNA